MQRAYLTQECLQKLHGFWGLPSVVLCSKGLAHGLHFRVQEIGLTGMRAGPEGGRRRRLPSGQGRGRGPTEVDTPKAGAQDTRGTGEARAKEGGGLPKNLHGGGGGGGAWSPSSNPPPPGGGSKGRLSFFHLFRAYVKSSVSHVPSQNCVAICWGHSLSAACPSPHLKCRPRLPHTPSQG